MAQARAFAVGAVSDIPASARATLQLLVSELATNCIIHAASEFTVRLFRGSGRLRVECSDLGAGMVQMRDAGPSDAHGRGIFFVRQLADDWGVRINDPGPGKTVWFVLSLNTSTEAAARA